MGTSPAFKFRPGQRATRMVEGFWLSLPGVWPTGGVTAAEEIG
jgi:hypothetical protein